MAIKLGILGAGIFADHFIPLFLKHPLVASVALCDHAPERLAAMTAKHGALRTFARYDDLLASDVDAVAIFTPHTAHGPQAVRALEAGKDVYSAVPAAIDMAEVEALVRAVERSGRIYMMGETSAYYAEAILCRERFARGDFGAIVYAQAEYIHDWEHGSREISERRFGPDWRRHAGMPPMHYPTHSIGMVLSVTGAHATHVSCVGVVDPGGPDAEVWTEDNVWRNRFSNQTALMRMSDGSAMRINELRRIGHGSAERMCLYGTEACFERSSDGRLWSGRRSLERLDPQFEFDHPQQQRARERLPAALRAGGGGHGGSHSYLADDFAKACAWRLAPPLNVWQAARYLVPGLIAVESARRGSELLAVPDFGAGPAIDHAAFARCADAGAARAARA
jgi:predicted dehydrogenase